MKLRIPAFSLFSGLSVFVKSCLLIAVTTLVVAGSLTYQNDKTFRAAVEKGVRTLGAGVTITVASQSGGAIRFGDTNRLAADIQKIIDLSEGRALAGIAVNKKGKVISTAGEISEADLEKLATIGHTAAESGVFEQSPNGYFVAAPAAAGADGSVIVGAIAMIWSPEVAFAEAAFDEMMSYVFAAAAFVIMCTLSVLALRSILSRPLAAATRSIEMIAEGDYTSEIPHLGRRDEIGRIANTLDNLKVQLAAAQEIEEQNKAAQSSQKHVVDTLTEALHSLSKGDLTHHIDSPFAEKYEPLRENYNAAVTQMVTIIESVIENSSRIQASSEEISQSSSDLSQRTESQAATLEETAAAMEELTVSVRSAADGAKEVEEIVSKAQDTAKRSGQVVTDAVDAMAQIESSSARISQIIGVIDDISFQTNLLALNAGVEAARAGEAGRGFAVVASEVRALAQRSSDAAQEIKQLIVESTQHVNTGVDLVGKAGGELEKIIERVGTISGHIISIAAGAEEQSTALAEINVGVSQLDQVTQHNAAMVEESTAASHILRNDATELARQVSVFKTGNVAAPSIPPTATVAPAAHPELGAEEDDFFADPGEKTPSEPLPQAVGWDDF